MLPVSEPASRLPHDLHPALPLGPVFPLRVTRGELQGLLEGLKPVLLASLSELANVGDDATSCPCMCCQFHNGLLDVYRAFRARPSQQARCRFRLNMVQLLFCQLAMRNVMRPTRALRARFTFRAHRGAKKTCAKLEALRKQAKRQYQEVYGARSYHELTSTWHLYLDCLRMRLSGRLPRALRGWKRPFPSSRMLFIDALVKSVIRELSRTGAEIPPPEELRRLVRMFLRYIRRGRMNLSISDCFRSTDAVAPEVADFVKNRFGKAKTLPRRKQ